VKAWRPGDGASLASALLALACLAPAARAAEGLRGQFMTPSGNAFCVVWGDERSSSLECELKENTARPPPKPKACELDFGNRFSLPARGMPTRACHGDTLQGHLPTLAYGTPWRVDGFACQVTTRRLRCTNADGHGFELSRARQTLF
jgi:hypothetical protein